jgi:hypothetical protein
MANIKELDRIVNEFNNTLSDFAKNLANIFPNSLIGNNLSTILTIINANDTKHKLIHTFICKVLPYKNEIDNGNEDFFVNKSFSDDTDDSNVMNSIFELKSLWKKLNNNNKKYVIQYMQLLCEISQDYYKCHNQK